VADDTGDANVNIGAFAGYALACLLATVPISFAVEGLRPRPVRPDRLAWAPGIALETAVVSGLRVRYIRTGSGPSLVLLHTLRTQLDIFQKVIPELARSFTVYAFDYPGHGWSDIPQADYAPEDFCRWTAEFLEAAGVEKATLAGVSIGGTIALVLAARGNPRVDRVVSINPYDYWPAGGIRRSSTMARLILGPADVPILGATLMRLRNRFVSDRIMEGGVASADDLSLELKKELYDVGARPGHYRAFLRLLAHEPLWADARKEYRRVAVPTLLVYGDRDWAPSEIREQERGLIPGVTMKTINGGGHFLPLDRPQELVGLISSFIGNAGSRSTLSA
jgi:pimeloyl-ACP methyl ester carboxylesterase